MTTHRPEPTTTPSQGAETARLFGRRLQRLVDAVHPAGRRSYTDAEIAAHVGVTAQYIRRLRNGGSVPSVEKAQSLAELFGIGHVDYFLKPDNHPAVLAVEKRLNRLQGAESDEDGTQSSSQEAHKAGAPCGMDADDELWRRLQEEHGVREIAMRAGQLSAEARVAVLGIVEQLFQHEKGDGRTEEK